MTARAVIGRSGCLATGILASTALAADAFAAEEGGGLPQLDFATWPTQVFWLVVTFGAAYLLMWKLVTPRIASVLEQRHHRINDDMRAAREATTEAGEMREAFEARLNDARMAAIEATRAASAQAKETADAKNARATERLNGRLDEAETAIMAARARALDELEGVAADGAADATSLLAGISVSPDEARRAVAAVAKAKTRP